MKYQHLDRFLSTEKQKDFERNFFVDADSYEVWDEVEIGKEYESEKKFDVKAEDIKAFSEAIMDTNPLFNDEEYAKNTPWGGLIGHPLFYIAIGFYCVNLGFCNWIRSPGAFNPGQRNLFYEPFRVGDNITVKLKSMDKWIKRGHHYLCYQQEYFDQDGTLKVKRWPTLIVPSSRSQLQKYLKI